MSEKKLQFKDNPVPSLDKIQQFLYENPHMFQSSPYNYKELCFKGIKEILQNGVETNKEQPKCECKHGESCDNTCLG